ncbi:MAG: tol-pal system protein YbgF [candidate division BRC1 bacterium ADurb.BinA364]|nr:MAG: tol-pal system protein YbgF [candidate division BRC1 bacterium ADurb.BinA364]
MSRQRFPLVLAALVAALTGGCTVFSASEVNQIQSDIREIKLELRNLRTQITDDGRRLQYSLSQIEEKLEIGREQLDSLYMETAAQAAERDANATLLDGSTIPNLSLPPAVPGPVPLAIPNGGGAGAVPEYNAAPAPTAPAPEAIPPLSSAAPVPILAPAGADSAASAGSVSLAGDVYRAGSKAWIAGDVEQARTLFEECLRLAPNGPTAPSAMFWIGECHYKNRNYAEAVRIYESILARYPDWEMADEASAKIGYCYLHLNDTAQARRAFQLALDRFPKYNQIDRIKEALASLPE